LSILISGLEFIGILIGSFLIGYIIGYITAFVIINMIFIIVNKRFKRKN